MSFGDPGGYSLGAAELGHRLLFFLFVMMASRAALYPSESKSMLCYSWKPKVGRGAQMDEKLIAEAVEAISVPLALLLSSLASLLVGAIAPTYAGGS